MADTDQFDEMLDRREVVVCAGAGGVGKTTVAASIALEAARRGERTLVMTIDPARRLANSMGVDDLDDRARQLPAQAFSDLEGGLELEGELWAMQLDMKESFDRLVERRAPDEQTREAILSNSIYRRFSKSLAGTQEYAAAERVHELHEAGTYDLLVVDTPPTTHALDFLDAPTRLADAVESRAFEWFFRGEPFADEGGMSLTSVGSSLVARTLERFTGREFLDEVSTFLEHLAPLLEGFRDRAEAVRELLTGDATRFVVVTTPQPYTRDESLHFYRALGDERVAVGGFVVNRVHPHWVSRSAFDRSTEEIVDQLSRESGGWAALPPEVDPVSFVERLRQNAGSFHVLAAKDEESIETLRDGIEDDCPVRAVPYFSTDVHSLAGLDRVRRAIFEE